MKKCVAGIAFAVIFLSALFLFMRNYPSDRWFSVVFIVAGGVSLWCVWGAGAAEGAGAQADEGKADATAAEATVTECAESTTDVTSTDTENNRPVSVNEISQIESTDTVTN